MADFKNLVNTMARYDNPNSNTAQRLKVDVLLAPDPAEGRDKALQRRLTPPGRVVDAVTTNLQTTQHIATCV